MEFMRVILCLLFHDDDAKYGFQKLTFNVVECAYVRFASEKEKNCYSIVCADVTK